MGGMCAYLIKTADKTINEPIARIAIKRLISITNKKQFIFVAEDRIYGDEEFAKELNFQNEVISILEKSNKETGKSDILFSRNDRR
jgi:hypothetical protein